MGSILPLSQRAKYTSDRGEVQGAHSNLWASWAWLSSTYLAPHLHLCHGVGNGHCFGREKQH
jgi:hypothetical protein